MCKVSVIIPVYNGEKFLGRCLDSVLGQTLSEIEILVINDGSSDHSLSICRNYAERDKRVQVYDIQNSGAAAARNVGLDHASGEFIGFVDADDWIEPEMYQFLYERASGQGAEIASCNLTTEWPDGRKEKLDNSYQSGVYKKQDMIHEIYPKLICSRTLSYEVPFSMGIKVFNRNFLEQNGIRFVPELLAGQDYVFASTAIMYASIFVYEKERYLYHYWQQEKSRTHRYLKNADQVYNGINHYWDKIASHFKTYDFSNQVRLDKLHGMLSASLYEFKPGNPKKFWNKYQFIKRFLREGNHKVLYRELDWSNLDLRKKVICILIQRKCYFMLSVSLQIYAYLSYRGREKE